MQSKSNKYHELRSAFDEDKQLHSQNCLSCGKSVKQLKTIFNLDTLDLSHLQFSKEMTTYYSGKLMNQLIFTCFTESLISWYCGFAISASFNSKTVRLI
jgi:hypothetical protein